MYFYMGDDEENNKEFLRAIKEEDIRMVEEGIRCGASEPVNEKLYFSLNDFLERYGNDEIVDIVNNERALHMSLIDAVLEQDLDKVKLAIENGAEINYINWEDKIPKTAFEIAFEDNDTEIIELLFNRRKLRIARC